SIFYDPMISKFAVYGRDRSEAIERMRRALQEYEVGGIKTTLPFFREVMKDAEFISGELDTGYIARFNERRSVKALSETQADIAIIAAAIAFQESTKTVVTNQPTASRWATAGRNSAMNSRL
ncbi:MAG TPA: hypothetical protein PKA82_18065, partial [Pyrinomonadaceae bacterium]|nr:hypothetical protein [Pyrinomonadaceae bacterium]